MQALTYSRFGSADCLQLTELDAPHPRAGQVLVQVADHVSVEAYVCV